MKVAMILANACAPDPRVEKEAAALAGAGHNVTIVAWDRNGAHPEDETREGFQIRRLGPRASYGGGVRSLPLFRAFWHSAAAYAAALRPDAIHCHDTDTLPAGLRARGVLRSEETHFVVDFHELYRLSSMVPQRGLSGITARWVVDRLERRAVSQATLVIVANPGTAGHYESIGRADKVVIIDNAPDPDLFVPRPCPETDRLFTACFVGSKRYARTLIALMDAVQRREGMRAVLAGGGPDAQRIAEAARAYRNVEVIGQVPYRDIPGYYACCDVVYAAYDTLVGNVRYTIPGKVIEAMGCAKPVIVSEHTWVGDYVTKHRIGLAVKCDDPVAIGEALDHLRAHPEEAAEMGERGRRIVEHGLNWHTVAARLVSAYANLQKPEPVAGSGHRA